MEITDAHAQHDFKSTDRDQRDGERRRAERRNSPHRSEDFQDFLEPEKEHREQHENQFEVSWVVVMCALIGLFAWGWANLNNRYSDLDRSKLDKSVFEEHQRNIAAIRDDMKAIREIVERHATHFSYREK